MLIATVVSIALGLAAPAAAGGPLLRVQDVAPFTVKGTHFRPAERVTITVRIKTRYVRRVVASSQGAFVTRFRALQLTGCQSYAVTANGNRGSRAFLKVVPVCPPPGPIG